MMTDYVSVDCARHSEYELAIMQRRRLALSWRGADNTVHTATVTPTDLLTRNGAEFMRLRDPSGREHIVRLDHITACTVL